MARYNKNDISDAIADGITIAIIVIILIIKI